MDQQVLQTLKSISDKIDYLIQNSGSGDIIIAALVGALAAIIPQLIMDYRRTKRDKENKLMELRSELYRITELIRDHYRELALHKAHKFYWWANYSIEKKRKESGKEHETEKMYNFHMSSSSKVRSTELKLSENFSLYRKIVAKIQMMTDFKRKVQQYLEEYKSYEPSKPKDLKNEDQEILHAYEAEEENRLREDYHEYIKSLEKINKLLA
jgi:hypothetical protein